MKTLVIFDSIKLFSNLENRMMLIFLFIKF